MRKFAAYIFEHKVKCLYVGQINSSTHTFTSAKFFKLYSMFTSALKAIAFIFFTQSLF